MGVSVYMYVTEPRKCKIKNINDSGIFIYFYEENNN